jgi:hypothetical protein
MASSYAAMTKAGCFLLQPVMTIIDLQYGLRSPLGSHNLVI